MLSRLVLTFLPRSKRSPSAVILEPRKIKSDTVSTVSPSICHEMMGPDAMIFVFWMLSLLFHSPLSLSFFLIFNFTLFYFTILYWFCHTLTWIHHGCTWVPKHEPPLPPPTPYHLSGSSPCTSPKHPVSCIKHRLAIRFIFLSFLLPFCSGG